MNDRSAEDPGRLTRIVATLILIPTVPMLLGSAAALALFYLAPGRFGAVLARLPGDELIRTVLIFAPATLLAVVVLAVLYAVDRPVAPAAGPPTPASPASAARRLDAARIATWGLLAPGLPLLVLSVGLWLFSFIAPGRFASLLEPLPGDVYLRLALRAAPVALLAVIIPAALFLLLAGERRRAPGSAQMDPGRPVRWGVGLSLLATIPLLLISLAALGVFLFSPERFASLMERFTQGSFIRLALVFTPAVLLSLVLLAVLFLFYSRRARELPAPRDQVEAAAQRLQQTRQGIALWVLTGGLAGSAIVALGLLAVALYLTIR